MEGGLSLSVLNLTAIIPNIPISKSSTFKKIEIEALAYLDPVLFPSGDKEQV
jgi:hypothetical protein